MIKKIIRIFQKIFWTNEKYARHIGVKIGLDCDIKEVHFGTEPYLITIGDHVQITNGVRIFTHGAAWVLREKHSDIDFFGKVEIKNNVYIGNNALIMPGVTIGNNVVIAAGSVVTKSIPNNCIVGGNPSKIIGNFKEFEIKMLEKNTKAKNKKNKKKYLLSLKDNMFIKK